MVVICPTITAEDPKSYREEVATVEPFAERLHIDLADGMFAPTKLLGPAQIYWPSQIVADLHVMYKKPWEQLETLVSTKPSLVIIHAEADGDLLGMLLELKSYGIKAGIALLAGSQPDKYAKLINAADHILLFAGKLGYQGGEPDLDVLKKIPIVRAINAIAELGWDGGITAENVPLLVQAGIEVLNVGGAIQHADDPKAAYTELTTLAAAQE